MQPGRGKACAHASVTSHIPIRVTRADIAAGRDPVLDAVRMR
jgi:hypothetical protein